MHREKNKNLIKKNEDCKETFGFIEKKEFKTITIQKIIKIRPDQNLRTLYLILSNGHSTQRLNKEIPENKN